MQLIFEDSREMAASCLLKRYLGSFVRFAGGNKNLCDEIENAISKHNYPIIVYIDVVPDNPEVVDEYIELRAEYQSGDVHIVPIPCIEYCILSVIEKCILLGGNAEYNEVMIGVLHGALLEQSKKVYRSYKNWKSFEQFCKIVLTQQVMQCVQNVNVKSGYNVKGKFYMEDCNCDERYTKNCKEKHTIWSKYCMLVKALGVLPYEMYRGLGGDTAQGNRLKCGEEIGSVHILYERLYDLVGYKRFLRFTW